MKKDNLKKGFTLVELLVGLGIISMLIVVASTFQRDIFFLNNNIQSNLNAQLEARHVIKIMIAELRKSTPSATGSYAIESASSTAVVFYTDVGDNGSVDRVRYFESGPVIRKGVTTPVGSPPSYNLNNEVVTTLVKSVISSSTLPFFQYFTSSYAGTSSPLTYPLAIASVRLVKVNVIIDTDPNRSPIPLIVTSQVSMRNLKDNL